MMRFQRIRYSIIIDAKIEINGKCSKKNTGINKNKFIQEFLIMNEWNEVNELVSKNYELVGSLILLILNLPTDIFLNCQQSAAAVSA